MNTGRLLLRAVIGGLFIGHGTQKLFGWFGGPGRGGTEQMMDGLGKVHLSLADGGPGELSADRALGIHRTGPGWALAALGAGAAASAITVELGHRNATAMPDRERDEPVREPQPAMAPAEA